MDIKVLVEKFDEEMEDACEYYHMAEEADEHGHHHLAHGLHMMAHDEFTHAKFFKDKLSEMDYVMTEEQREHWAKVKRYF
jgi:rubrerythrin